MYGCVCACALCVHVCVCVCRCMFARACVTGLGCEQYLLGLKNLCDVGLLQPYPPLVDVKGCYTAQVCEGSGEREEGGGGLSKRLVRE